MAGFWTDRADVVYSDAQGRHAPQKGLPRQLVKEEKKKAKVAKDEQFRADVWARDKGKSRASGRKLSRSALDWNQRGEVHHTLKRSTAPEHIYTVSRGILLAKSEHALAGTRCPNAIEFFMLDITGPDDLGELQTFTWRDQHGKVTKTRIG